MEKMFLMMGRRENEPFDFSDGPVVLEAKDKSWVVLTRERWERHIIVDGDRAHLAQNTDHIRETVLKPDRITQSYKSSVRIYQKRVQRFRGVSGRHGPRVVMVVVDFDMDSAIRSIYDDFQYKEGYDT